jgi:D-sedoheptulose 7-phosphate isomerase
MRARARRGLGVSAVDVIDDYLASLAATLAALEREPLQAAHGLLEQARSERRTIFVFGNGGSATTAAHVACDLGKNTRVAGKPGLRVISLVSELGTLSAFANDEGYESVFAEPLRALAEPGDVAIAISAGGSSPNVVRALEVARELGLSAIGLTGSHGGDLPTLVDACLRAPTDSIEQVEDVHLVINHVLTLLLRG